MTDKFISALNKCGMTEPQLAQVIHFNIVKTMSNYVPEIKEHFPADYKYWIENGWLDKKSKFFYDSKLKLH